MTDDPMIVAITDDPAALGRLRARLGAAAAADGLLDVAYRTVDSPLGTLLLAATPIGVTRIAFANEDQNAVLGMLAQRVSPRILEAPARLDPLVRELEEYFAGQRLRFSVPIDLQLVRGPFQRRVVEHLPAIGFGRTESYADVARELGNARAVRAVGTACATNPLPLVLPCHRVIRTDGQTGNYRGGPEAKRLLLALESHRP